MQSSIVRYKEFGIISATVVLVVIFSFYNLNFLLYDNLTSILRASSFIGIVSIGMAFLLISGTIDLSLGSIAGLANVLTSYLIVIHKFPVIPSIIAGLVLGAIIGWINFNLIYRIKIPAFLATIGMLYILRGLAQVISNGYTIYPLPNQIQKLGEWNYLGLSLPFILFVLLCVLSGLALSHSVWGLCVRAIGSDRETARNTEVNVNKISLSVFILAGVLSSLAGLLLMSRVITGNPNTGTGWELQSITACAVGGVSLFGYEGSLLGVFLGVVIIQLISNGLVVIGISAYFQNVIIGVVLLVITAIDFQRREKLSLGV